MEIDNQLNNNDENEELDIDGEGALIQYESPPSVLTQAAIRMVNAQRRFPNHPVIQNAYNDIFNREAENRKLKIENDKLNLIIQKKDRELEILKKDNEISSEKSKNEKIDESYSLNNDNPMTSQMANQNTTNNDQANSADDSIIVINKDSRTIRCKTMLARPRGKVNLDYTKLRLILCNIEPKKVEIEGCRIIYKSKKFEQHCGCKHHHVLHIIIEIETKGWQSFRDSFGKSKTKPYDQPRKFKNNEELEKSIRTYKLQRILSDRDSRL